MINDLVGSIPPIVKTVMLAAAIGALTLAVADWVDAWLVASTMRVPLLLVVGWFGMTMAWLVPLTFRIWEAMEADDGTEE